MQSSGLESGDSGLQAGATFEAERGRAAATTDATLSGQAQQERSKPELPERGQAELKEATTIDLDIGSRLAEAQRRLDQPWHPPDNSHGGPANGYRDDRLIRVLGELQSIFTEILRSVDDDPRMMDRILESAHQLVEGIRNIVKQRVFVPDGLDPSRYKDTYDIFELTRGDENAGTELYANDLDRYRRQQLRDLDVVLKRRRIYIAVLQDFQAQASSIFDYLRERSYRS